MKANTSNAASILFAELFEAGANADVAIHVLGMLSEGRYQVERYGKSLKADPTRELPTMGHVPWGREPHAVRYLLNIGHGRRDMRDRGETWARQYSTKAFAPAWTEGN